MSHKRNKKKTLSRNAALYERAVDLYFNNNKPDEALSIFLKLAKANFKKAFGEIGIILYREKRDVEKAEKWFIKAEKAGTLLAEAACEYGLLHYLEKDDWETGLRYLLKAAEQGNALAYGDIGTILYLYKEDIDGAESWFEKAEREECLFAPAAFSYGQLLMIERNDWGKSEKFFKQSSDGGFDPAYGEYASVLYLNKLDVDKAEEYFKKAEECNCLSPPNANVYGELLIKERNEIERGNKYLDWAESEGY